MKQMRFILLELLSLSKYIFFLGLVLVFIQSCSSGTDHSEFDDLLEKTSYGMGFPKDMSTVYYSLDTVRNKMTFDMLDNLMYRFPQAPMLNCFEEATEKKSFYPEHNFQQFISERNFEVYNHGEWNISDTLCYVWLSLPVRCGTRGMRYFKLIKMVDKKALVVRTFILSYEINHEKWRLINVFMDSNFQRDLVDIPFVSTTVNRKDWKTNDVFKWEDKFPW